MTAARSIGEGRVVTVTAGGTITAGDVYEGVNSIGVYLEDAVSGDAVAVAMQGEWEIDKETGVVFTLGDFLYYDATNDRLDKTATNIPAGLATAAAATGATRARVLLGAGAILNT